MPDAWVDRAAVEFILGVGRRRAQQILRPLVRQTIGKNGLAARDELIQHLRRLAAGEPAYYEKRRRERFHSILEQMRVEAREQPKVLVEAPQAIRRQELDRLPEGVRLSPGRIVIEKFQTAEEAQRKLLALIMAMGNDPGGFEVRIASPEFRRRD
ncbi:MAG: hypothetical protein ACRD4P_13290 [Bryobacteraceae bacterium]